MWRNKILNYNNLSSYLKSKYNCKVAKICIDGGFSCPNRDGTCGFGGCIFCGERGAGEHINPRSSIRSQVESYFSRQPKAEKFIAYFQNFTNTYAPVEVLKERYDEALIDPRIVVLDIGTRPDCINEEIVQLLAEYNKKYEVWVELGLQTANDNTAQFINRGYKRDVFNNAVALLHKYGIKIVVHLIIGLPHETQTDIKNTVAYINQFPIWGLKVHSLYVMKDTNLEKLYNTGTFTPQSMQEYIDNTVYVLTHVNPTIIIHRLTGDCPKDMLVAPDWNERKTEILNSITTIMEKNKYTQGIFF